MEATPNVRGAIEARHPVSAPLSAAADRSLLEHFFARKAETTIRGYRSDLEHFARFLAVPSIDDAAAVLLGNGNAGGNRLLLSYVEAQRQAGLAAATINRRLAALRSLAKLARLLGMSDVMLDVQGERIERDVPRIPTADELRRLVEILRARSDAKGRRDLAVLLLAAVHGLRRAEIASLRTENVAEGTMRILGKGRRQRQTLNLAPIVAAAIDGWLAVRPETDHDALFVSLAPVSRGKPMTGSGIYKVFRSLGRQVGFPALRPHLARRSAATMLLDLSGGDVRSAQHFMRHASPSMTMAYDSTRVDHHGKGARALADFLAIAV